LDIEKIKTDVDSAIGTIHQDMGEVEARLAQHRDDMAGVKERLKKQGDAILDLQQDFRSMMGDILNQLCTLTQKQQSPFYKDSQGTPHLT
jgi:ABC-type Fe3+-citrate transport system substrate-binding protein